MSPLLDQITGFGQVSALTMIQHLLSIYGVIDKIDLEENAAKIMGPYDHAEPLAQWIKKLEKGRELARAGGQTIADAMMVSKGITLLAHMTMFNEDIREWRRQTTDQNSWARHENLFH